MEAGADCEVLVTSVPFVLLWAEAKATRPKAATAVKKRMLKERCFDKECRINRRTSEPGEEL